MKEKGSVKDECQNRIYSDGSLGFRPKVPIEDRGYRGVLLRKSDVTFTPKQQKRWANIGNVSVPDRQSEWGDTNRVTDYIGFASYLQMTYLLRRDCDFEEGFMVLLRTTRYKEVGTTVNTEGRTVKSLRPRLSSG